MEVIATRPKSLTDLQFTYCPGCTHGISHRLIAETMDELDIRNNTMGVAPVGCSVFAYKFFDCDMAEAAHGRAPAVATGMIRSRPDMNVFTYQGDGDLAAIGTAEIIHAANRGENITVFFVNNAIYGMTGGQMAPTTLPGMKTSTSPYGRDEHDIGYPIQVCELLSTLRAPYYIERVSLLTPAGINKAKKAVKKAMQANKDKKGFCLIEFVSTCPTNWGMAPIDAIEWAKDKMLSEFKLGVFRDKSTEEGGK